MKYVEIYKLDLDGNEIQGGKVILGSDSKVSFDNKITVGLLNHMKEGIRGAKFKVVTPEDGLEFLEGLQYEFKSPYLRASEVREEE